MSDNPIITGFSDINGHQCVHEVFSSASSVCPESQNQSECAQTSEWDPASGGAIILLCVRDFQPEDVLIFFSDKAEKPRQVEGVQGEKRRAWMCFSCPSQLSSSSSSATFPQNHWRLHSYLIVNHTIFWIIKFMLMHPVRSENQLRLCNHKESWRSKEGIIYDSGSELCRALPQTSLWTQRLTVEHGQQSKRQQWTIL